MSSQDTAPPAVSIANVPVPRPCCRECGNEIDSEWCWCGDRIDRHGYHAGHSPVPMGCTCGYGKSSEETSE